MDEVRELALALCGAIICGSVLWLIAPKTAASKSLRIVLAAFIICASIAPVMSAADAIGSISINTQTGSYSISALESTLSRHEASALEGCYETLIARVLSAQGAEAEKICISVNREQDGSICIGHAEITLRNDLSERQEDIKKAIESSLGITAVVTTEGKNET